MLEKLVVVVDVIVETEDVVESVMEVVVRLEDVEDAVELEELEELGLAE